VTVGGFADPSLTFSVQHPVRERVTLDKKDVHWKVMSRDSNFS
jgi:hypothetical protein